MKVEQFNLTKATKGTGLRASWGSGCNLKGCNCSPGYWISFFDGKKGVTITFKDKKEMNNILKKEAK